MPHEPPPHVQRDDAPAADDQVPVSPGMAFDPIDWDYIHSAMGSFVSDLIDRYFRARLIGAEQLPDDGPLILAPNHSGNALPYDGFILDALLWRRGDCAPDAKFRSVYTPALSNRWWMRPFGLDDWWRRCGSVDMSFRNYDRLLARGDKIIHYPEGVPGIGKGFNRRYQLQPFHASFVTLAAKHDAPIHLVSVVNAEWINPTSITFEPLNKLFQKLLGLPFFPIPIIFLALLFPFVFYLAFPGQLTFVIGEQVDVQALLREEGCQHPEHPEPAAARRVAERIRQQAQQQLDEALQQHGEKPYKLRGLIQALKEIPGRIFRSTPLGWPLAFVQHERDRQRPSAKNRLHAFFRDLDLIAYYLPFGWLLIAALRELRQPPYGYRGLSREERSRREGAYQWSLAQHPLPERDAENKRVAA